MFQFEAPCPQVGASRARSGEPDASKGSFVHIVPLNPAYKAGLAGHAPVRMSGYSHDIVVYWYRPPEQPVTPDEIG